MRRRVPVLVGATVLVAALVLSVLGAQAQMRRGGARGMVRMACNIEGLWAELAFNAKVDDAKLSKMRPVFQKAWDERAKVGEGVTSREDIPEAFPKLEEIGIALLDDVKKATTEDELKKLSPWIESQNEILEMIRERLGV
jgi:hypothetical protein